MAHGANVNCLALGHKSGRVLVTGGDDKKVNLWAVGKPNCIMVSKLIFILLFTLHFRTSLHNGIKQSIELGHLYKVEIILEQR